MCHWLRFLSFLAPVSAAATTNAHAERLARVRAPSSRTPMLAFIHREPNYNHNKEELSAEDGQIGIILPSEERSHGRFYVFQLRATPVRQPGHDARE